MCKFNLHILLFQINEKLCLTNRSYSVEPSSRICFHLYNKLNKKIKNYVDTLHAPLRDSHKFCRVYCEFPERREVKGAGESYLRRPRTKMDYHNKLVLAPMVRIVSTLFPVFFPLTFLIYIYIFKNINLLMLFDTENPHYFTFKFPKFVRALCLLDY